MSLNKNALIRYRALDSCFQNRNRRYYFDDLLKAVNAALYEFNDDNSGINRRQLFDDIRYMESEQGWAIPLEKIRDGKKVYYRYSDTDFSISKKPITDDEKAHLESALHILAHFSGTPQFEMMQEIIPVLQEKLQFRTSGREFIELQTNLDLKGLPFLQKIYNSIKNKEVLSVHYKDFKSLDVQTFVFHPHFLKQYNNRWFVFGLHEALQIPTWNLALDRIVELNYYSSDYIETEIDWMEYFYDIIGVTKPQDKQIETIELEISSESAPYVVTKPLHASQKVIQTEPILVIQINVIPNYELKSLILSFGSTIRVVKPEFLVNLIREEVKKMNER